eukprot:441526-Pyramimonas_sp.AAC.1
MSSVLFKVLLMPLQPIMGLESWSLARVKHLRHRARSLPNSCHACQPPDFKNLALGPELVTRSNFSRKEKLIRPYP